LVEKEFQQLRFDVSENIRLHPQKPGIGTLLELDLFPDVECKDEGKQLKIEGFLRLNGAYMAEGEKGEQQLSENMEDGWEEISYVIPVEITLPADRAEFEHISAEVESFDYHIASPYELQITAILLIDGILPEKEEEEPEKVDFNEVIHEEPTFSAEPVMLASLSEEEEMEKKENEPILQQEKKTEPTKESKSPQTEKAQHRPAEKRKSEQSKVIEAKETVQDDLSPQKEEKQEQKKAKEIAESLVKSNKSLKIDEEETEQFDEAELIEKQETVLEEDQGEEAVKEKRKSPEWIHWLVRSREESYQPMRMVIVQRSQPIEQLAEQYQVSKDRLIEANQLKTDFIDEGAILYIPEESQAEAKGL
jgi:stage VI sporulation protein D